jgi:hypothetical protein
MKITGFALPTCLAVAIVATPAGSVAGSYALLMSGAAESVDVSANTVSVMGHTFSVADASRVILGHQINVFGAYNANGSIKPSFIQDTARFAAGGDQVFTSGAVTAINSARGILSVGGAAVDYTSLLAQSDFRLPAVGDVVGITGIQPAGKGLVLAAEIHSLYGVTAGGIMSSGVTAGGNPMGVTAGGIMSSGVTAGGNPMGVTAGGIMSSGVTAGGNPMGVTAGGIMSSGVTAGGKPVGVTAGGIMSSGVTAGGNPL